MADNFGLSFAPLGQSASGASGSPAGPGGTGGSVNPLQDAIRVLSLRIPRTVGASPIAPAPLLNAVGSAGVSQPQGTPMQPGMDLETLLRRLFGMGTQAAPPTTAAPPYANPPSTPSTPS